MTVAVLDAAQLPYWAREAQFAPELELGTRVECDLLIWFASHPGERFALAQLESKLAYSRAALGAGIQKLAETGILQYVTGKGRQVWTLTNDPPLSSFVCAVTAYLSAHPEVHSLRVQNGTP